MITLVIALIFNVADFTNSNILSYSLSVIMQNVFTTFIVSLLPSVHWNKVPATDKYGDFDLLLDEELYQNSDHSAAHRGKQPDRHSAPRWK